MSMIKITFPDGSVRDFEKGVTGYQIAQSISPRLAAEVLSVSVNDQVCDLRFPIETQEKPKVTKLRVHTFGEFEVFTENGVPLDFVYSKTRELLAVLIDANGAMRTFDQIMERIWQDEDDAGSHRSYMRNLFADMSRIFAECGCSDALIRRRGEAGINKNYFDCDYFDFLDGKRNDSGFTGEYMNQYSWAEPTLGKLFQLSDGFWE